MVDKKQSDQPRDVPRLIQTKARRLNKHLKKIPNQQLGLFMKVIALALECGVNPFAPSKAQKGKRP